jgi:hypothetical protein
MTKKMENTSTTDNTATNNPNMTTTTLISQNTTVATAANVVLENPNGTSHRLVVYNRKDWNPATDLSLLDLSQGRAGLNSIAKWVAGGIKGSAKLLIVAPTAKLAFANGTGTFAYVRNDFVPGVDDLTIDVDGTPMFLTVDGKDVPNTRGYRRLHLDGGELYAKSWEPIFTHSDEDPFVYWYCRCLSAILEGNNVSVSIGPKLLADAEEVIKVVNSDDRAAANDARLYVGRVSSRFSSDVKANATEIIGNAVESGRGVTIGASDLIVPLAGGGTISLVRFNKTTPIRVMTEGGQILRPRFLSDDTDVARLAFATTMRQQHLSVALTQ